MDMGSDLEASPCDRPVTAVGAVGDPGAHRVRIVHISDTHYRHDDFIADIPSGDILVHSGDFGSYAFSKLFRQKHHFKIEIDRINAFFAKVPHKHAVFVCGNHDLYFPAQTQRVTQTLLSSCHYLQDSAVTLQGVKFYGAPWNGRRLSSLARAFSVGYGRTLGRHWDDIPPGVDVVVTHTPPRGVLDLSIDCSPLKDRGTCKTCGKSHPGWWHWGCPYLKKALVDRVRPKLHLFGHCHERNGVIKKDGIVFSNAAMDAIPQANVFDFYVPASEKVILGSLGNGEVQQK